MCHNSESVLSSGRIVCLLTSVPASSCNDLAVGVGDERKSLAKTMNVIKKKPKWTLTERQRVSSDNRASPNPERLLCLTERSGTASHSSFVHQVVNLLKAAPTPFLRTGVVDVRTTAPTHPNPRATPTCSPPSPQHEGKNVPKETSCSVRETGPASTVWKIPATAVKMSVPKGDASSCARFARTQWLPVVKVSGTCVCFQFRKVLDEDRHLLGHVPQPFSILKNGFTNVANHRLLVRKSQGFNILRKIGFATVSCLSLRSSMP